MMALIFRRWQMRCIADFLTVIIWGIPLGCFFLLLIILGRIRIHGYMRAIRLVTRGRVIIAANHPSMLETLLIPLSFFPWYLYSLRLFVWSVPDQRLLPPWMRVLFWIGRCVTVDRSKPNSNKHALRELAAILERKGVIVIHPEAGRTFKGQNFLFCGNRKIRHFTSGVPALARNTGATILPLWVSGSDKVLPAETFFPRFIQSKIILSFGIPYHPPQEKNQGTDESYTLAQAILRS
ncbi:MAG: lysophospholipid acyltransferase family protein [Candidatus Sungbacteria bacterium]|nr:lysophospholipid acyltransferase family protein [bacterium]MDZ4260210.1 lysophospholipid acyltransferase family protein [Candidatus Sungbacteria bacterium]